MPNFIEHFGQDHFKKHKCTSIRTKNWFIFKCPHCAYERKINRHTNEMIVKPGDPEALHEGVYVPVGINLNTLNAN